MIPYARPVEYDVADIAEKLQSISGGTISNGKFCRELEARVAELVGAKHCIATGCCTQALVIATQALGKAYSPQIAILPSFTWKSTLYAARVANLVPKFVDIDPSTFLARFDDLTFLGKELVVAVDTFGQRHPGAPEHKGPSLVDAAHSLGADTISHLRATIECYSMSPSKLITAGEGGIIATNDSELAKMCEAARDFVSRMSEFNAIVGLQNLRKWGEIRAKKFEAVSYYLKHLGNIFKFQAVPHPTNYYVCAALCKDRSQREMIVEKLKDEVQFKVYFEPLHRTYIGPRHRSFQPIMDNTDLVYSKVLCLPSWPGVSYERVAELVEGAMK